MLFSFSLFKKLLCSFIFLGVVIFSVAPKAEALLGVGDIVSDPGNTVQGILQVGEATVQTYQQTSINYKEYVLDLLVNLVAKQLINSMTQSIVNWINSGFNGSPSFVTDPGSFFLDAADQVTGAFISKSGVLSSLCSPFSFDLRIHLALETGGLHKRYTCTLATIIQNTRDAAERGVTINGFMAGDFSQGGWPAFISLSTESQNSYSSAYLSAHSDLLSRIAQKEAGIDLDLNRGRGFLSWEKCEDVPIQGAESAPGEEPNVVGSDFTGPINEPAGQVRQKRVCRTETPGSVIESTLNNQLASGVRTLELADEINEIAGALVNQLVIQILNAGLGSASKGSNGGKSAVDRILGEDEKTIAQVRKLGKALANKLAPYLDRDEKVIGTYQQSFNLIQNTQSKYLEAKACWIRNDVPAEVSAIDSALTTKVMPLFNQAQEDLHTASSSTETLLEIQRVALSATTLAELQPASDAFSDMLQQGTLRTSSDLQNAKDELDTIRDAIGPLNNEAATSLSECKDYEDSI